MHSSELEPPRLEMKDLVLLQKIEYLHPQPLEIVSLPTSKPCTPKLPHSPKRPFEYLRHLLPLLPNAFVVEHILAKLPMDPSMM
jgi:hypothetical protein